MQFGKKSLNEKFVYILFPLCCVSSSTIAFAASVWMPDQRVEIVVGVSAGAGSDMTARRIQRAVMSLLVPAEAPTMISTR